LARQLDGRSADSLVRESCFVLVFRSRPLSSRHFEDENEEENEEENEDEHSR
jgi:hypothetical protein